MRCLPLALLLACHAPATTEVERAPVELDVEVMDPTRLLTRVSLDLRGVRPSEAELDEVASDPQRLESLIDGFLYDPRFESRVVELFASVLRTRSEELLIALSGYSDPDEEERIMRSAGEEPLRIIARVAALDLPVTEIVTADWTMVNERLRKLYPVEASEGRGWRTATWTDGRPGAGILSSNGLWWRYPSSGNNANRQRANQVSRILLCSDYLELPVTFDRNEGVGEEDFEDRTRTDPSCTVCHQTLDPLAGYLYGFERILGQSEVTRYHPGRERMWMDATGVEPAYFGKPAEGLDGLGRAIADDSRFRTCMAQHVFEGLVARPVDADEAEVVERHGVAMHVAGDTLRAAFASVVRGPAYRGSSHPGANPAKLASPALLASQVEGLTGWRWMDGDDDLLASDLHGYLTLAGGADGRVVTTLATDPSPTILLVQQRLAETAAAHAVQSVLAGEQVPLLDAIELSWRPDTNREAMLSVLGHAHRRALGQPLTDGEGLLALWTQVHALEGEPSLAWTAVLAALLRDPDFLLY